MAASRTLSVMMESLIDPFDKCVTGTISHGLYLILTYHNIWLSMKFFKESEHCFHDSYPNLLFHH